MNNSNSNLKKYLDIGEFINIENQEVIDYTNTLLALNSELPKIEIAVILYKKIRDNFRYDPKKLPTRQGFRASEIIKKDYGNCIEKAIVLAAACRLHEIPARLGFANVRNHIATGDIEKTLGTNVLVFHGYTDLLLENNWVKATPAFNKSLCEKIGVAPLEFNGSEDSVFQQYAPGGGSFMEYLVDHGHYPDLPYDHMMALWREHYPQLVDRWAEGNLF
jgi:transglutaminase-like putative cysteine protease